MKSLHRYYRIKATPEDIYGALTNPFSIELWTGSRAEMKPEEGSEFSLFDGDIAGINIEFIQDKRIVQEWYFGDREEQSIVTILLRPDRIYTKVELTQTNIPDEAFDDILYGWDNFYFGGLRDFFEK